jgi:cytochrome P450
VQSPSREEKDAASLADAEEVLGLILDPDRRGSLYPYYHRLRELAPVHATRLFPNERAWVVSSYDHVNRLLRDREMLSDVRSAELLTAGPAGAGFDQVMSRLLLFIDGDEHDRIRNLVSRVFTPRGVEARHAKIRSVVDGLIDAAKGKGRAMDLVKDFAYPIPLVVICEMLGVPHEDLPIFHQWAYDFARRGDISDLTPERIEKGEVATEGFTRYFSDLIEARRAEPREDLITALISVKDDLGPLSHQDLISTCIILLQAGHETTADLIGTGTKALLENPDQMALLLEDPARIPTAVEELLRLDTPVQIMQRVSTRDEELGGVKVPAGEIFVILPVPGAANHDSSVFADPDRVDVTRDPNPHVSFGLGRHRCLGATLARTEIRIALSALLRRLPELELVPGEAPEYRRSLFLRGLARLPVQWAN